jgi:hypothetical protein
VLGSIVAFTGAVGGALWMHMAADRERDSLLAKISAEVSEIKSEIGTHDTGMIGQLHRYSKIITRLCDRAGIEQ